MNIVQNLVPPQKYPIKCPNAMSPIGVCIHNTANDAPAKNEISYMISNDLQTSFHYAVDDIEAVQGLPLDRNGWHAGDGTTGPGNRKHIGIEICYSKSGGTRFDKAEENGAELTAIVLKKYGFGIDRVKKHQDFSGKYCPHRTLDLGWDRFLNMVRSKMEAAPMPETITVNKSDWDRLLKASKLGDRLINGLDVAGNIADKDESQIDLLINKWKQIETDKNNAQSQLALVPQKLLDAEKKGYDKGFVDGKNSVPSTNPPQPSYPIDMTKYEQNGLTIEVTEGNTKKIINYKKVA